MMRSEPHPSSTAEKSRFSMMAVTAIHQRLENAVARVGAMVVGGDRGGRDVQSGAEETADSKLEAHTRREWAPLADAQDEGSLICEDKRHGEGL